MSMFGITRRSKRRQAEAAQEAEHDARLAEAEEHLARLTERGSRAVATLDARDRRNHWRESIENMIQGAH